MAEEQQYMKRCYARMQAEVGEEELRRTVNSLQKILQIFKEER